MSERTQPLDQYDTAAAHLSPVLSAATACEFLGISRRTFGRCIAEQRISVLRTSHVGGGRIRVLRSELVRLLRSMGGAA